MNGLSEFLASMVGARTILVSVLLMLAPWAAKYGFAYDAGEVANVLLTVYGAIMLGMRTITRTPVKLRSSPPG